MLLSTLKASRKKNKTEKERVKSVNRDTIATQKEAIATHKEDLKKFKAENIALKAKLAAARKQSEPARPKDGPAHPKISRELRSPACLSNPRAQRSAQRVEVDLSKPSVDDKGRLECSTCGKKYNFQDSIFFLVVVKHFLRVQGTIVELL